MRRSWRPPSKGVVSHSVRISSASGGATMRPMDRTLASLCSRDMRAGVQIVAQARAPRAPCWPPSARPAPTRRARRPLGLALDHRPADLRADRRVVDGLGVGARSRTSWPSERRVSDRWAFQAETGVVGSDGDGARQLRRQPLVAAPAWPRCTPTGCRWEDCRLARRKERHAPRPPHARPGRHWPVVQPRRPRRAARRARRDDGRALRRAAADSGASGDLLGSLDALRVVAVLSRRYRNSARLVAGRRGPAPRRGAQPRGGQRALALANRACLDTRPARPTWWRSAGPRPGAPAAPHPRRAGGPRRDPSVPAAFAGLTWRWNHPAEIARGILPPAQVPAVRAGPATRPAGRSRTTWSGSASCGPGSRRWRPATPRLDPGPVDRRGDLHALARQPLGVLAAHQGHERQQRGGAGGGADPVLGGQGGGAGRAPAPLGVLGGRHPGPRHLRAVAPARPAVLGRHPAGGGGGCSPWRAPGSTTWRTSTCTRASRWRWRSARPRSAWASTGR